jgi:hypothetical protein
MTTSPLASPVDSVQIAPPTGRHVRRHPSPVPRLAMQYRRRLLVSSLLAGACTGGGDAARVNDRTGVPPADAAAAYDDSVGRARQDSINRAQPGYVVDSILPPDEAWRRFTADIATQPAALANGAWSRDALVAKWVGAIEANDSVTVIRTAMNRPEFAVLVYPSSPSSRPPLYQPPAVLWNQLSSASLQGFRRAMVRLGGRPLGFLSYQCAPEPERQGDNRLWRDCTVRRVRSPGDTVMQRLFGAILERDGHFKFHSLGNDM